MFTPAVLDHLALVFPVIRPSLSHLVTAHASDSMFLCIDFVRITNCFYDYDYVQSSIFPTQLSLVQFIFKNNLIRWNFGLIGNYSIEIKWTQIKRVYLCRVHSKYSTVD